PVGSVSARYSSTAWDITVPGHTVFTRMPSGARARARFFDALAMAALAAVWAMSPGLWCRIDASARVTMRANTALRSTGSGARARSGARWAGRLGAPGATRSPWGPRANRRAGAPPR